MGRKVFAGLVAIAFLYVSSPLLYPIAMGGVIAVLFSPWLKKLQTRKISLITGSAFLTTGITAVLILPTSLLAFFTAKTGVEQLQNWKNGHTIGEDFFETLIHLPLVHKLMVVASTWLPASMAEIARAIQDAAGSIGGRLTEVLGGMLTHLPGMAVSLGIIVVGVYFFLVDGPRLVAFLRRNSIFTPRQTDMLIQRVGETCRSVILASVTSGAIQAGLETIACVATGTPNVGLIALSVFVGSFIPLIGSAPITFGVAIHQWVEGNSTSGMILLALAFVLIAVDNTVRPLFLKGSVNLHPLLAFVAAFGGLQTIGFSGVFLGPILAALFVETIQILIHASPEEI